MSAPDTSNSDVKGGASSTNPQKWPEWKKNAQILMVAFHSMVATFMAAGIIPAYDTMAEVYGVTVPQASYLTSMQILLLGICPLFWKPLTSIYGRYHIFILSVLGSMVCNIGGARCTTYGTQMATRVLTAIFISPPMGIGSGIITELCEPEKRAQKLGWWTLMLTLGTPGGPFIMGFVTKHIGYQWMFWIFAIMNFCQLVAYLFLGEETLHIPENSHTPAASPHKSRFYHKFIPRRMNPRPFKAREFVEPLFYVRLPRVLIPACAHAIVFCYGNIALIVEMPIAFGEKFGFDSQQIGLQFIAIIIGCLLGEQLSGPISDRFLQALQKRRGHYRPADRLWLSYVGFGTVIAGLLVWGFQLSKATSWNVTPCVGAAIASFGNQVITTILISFAIDSHREVATDIGVCINVFRHLYGFIGPFYFPDMFDTLGLAGAAGVMCAIVGACAMLPIVAVHVVATQSDW
ncbi:MFS general substrate transporter [Aspergillus japonicus CBS 114.51]|uniref:MFS general substrate transporter n=2 Tax=Aspergillus TaxID=5052 RepID=A0A2V5IT88_ASPV1|nr:MFS general substrate transporter [Aspergillus japonicus CBS 114.51]PYI23136.1 MFS general substrate transporter [Aspergillus violaceofuscus CBS 115571]RAH81016.1 MFS general substrate transporter [Aspergillus japonicus CBS 114.51]